MPDTTRTFAAWAQVGLQEAQSIAKRTGLECLGVAYAATGDEDDQLAHAAEEAARMVGQAADLLMSAGEALEAATTASALASGRLDRRGY